MGAGSAGVGRVFGGLQAEREDFSDAGRGEQGILFLFRNPEKDTFTIKKNTWGYLTIDVRTEGEFLSVEHTKVTTEEFIGNAYRLEYIIDYTKLHRGSNFGQITPGVPV